MEVVQNVRGIEKAVAPGMLLYHEIVPLSSDYWTKTMIEYIWLTYLNIYNTQGFGMDVSQTCMLFIPDNATGQHSKLK